MNEPKYPKLFEPGLIGRILVKNRIVLPPCTTNYAGPTGEVTDRLISYYAERARGGAGLLIIENTQVKYPEGKNGRPPLALETMLRIHCMQQWFTLSDLAMEEAFFDTPIYREFAQLDAHGRIPDESTILRFRHRLEKHRLADQILATVNELLAAQGLLLKAGTAVDATLIAAPSSTKNKDRKRDPEMHSSQKGNEWHFGTVS